MCPTLCVRHPILVAMFTCPNLGSKNLDKDSVGSVLSSVPHEFHAKGLRVHEPRSRLVELTGDVLC